MGYVFDDGFMSMNIHKRGNCKTPRPRKIDDFESICQPLGRLCPIPERILQASRAWGWGGKMAQKGDFAWRGVLQFPQWNTLSHAVIVPFVFSISF